jgi:hypothetical protein
MGEFQVSGSARAGCAAHLDACGREPGLQFGDGAVGRRRQQRVDQLGVVGELGAPAAADRIGRQRAGANAAPA